MKDILPDPPVELTDAGRKMYDKVGQYLIKNGLFKSVDVILLFALVIQWEDHVFFARESREKGRIQVFPNGTRQMSPEHSGLQKSLEKIYKLSDKLGIGEGARKKLGIFEGEGVVDPVDELGEIG